MELRIGVLLVAGALSLSGCASLGFGNGGAQSTSGGATPSAARIIEAMGGGLVGGDIGKSLSSGEKRKALEAEYRALEYSQSGQTVNWTGGGSNFGAVVPAQPYRVGSQDCRQYTHTITSSGRSETARGTACRNSDGTWTTLS